MAFSTFKGVRYIRIPTLSLKLVSNLGTEEKVLYLDKVYEALKYLESGQKVEMAETGVAFLDMALSETIPEMVEGYKQYLQNVNNGRKDKSPPEQCSSGAQAVPEQCPSGAEAVPEPIEENGIEGNEIEPYLIELPPSGGRDLGVEVIAKKLTESGIQADEGFWNTARKYGYEKAHKALDFAIERGISSIKEVTKWIKDGTPF